MNPRRQVRGARRGNRVAKQALHISSRTHPTPSPRPAPAIHYPLSTTHYPTPYATPVMSYCSAVCVAFALDPLRSDSPWRKLTVTTVCRF